jgi:hypothetical protein
MQGPGEAGFPVNLNSTMELSNQQKNTSRVFLDHSPTFAAAFTGRKRCDERRAAKMAFRQARL